MKILQVGKYYYPYAGGIETVLKNLSEGLVQAGDEVTVLCSSDSPHRVEETLAGVRVIRVPYYGKFFSQPVSPTLPVELLALSRWADLIQVHTPNPLAESAVLALPTRKPILISYHSDIVRQRYLLPFYAPVLKAFLLRARRIVVATQNHILHSPFLKKFRNKTVVIPFGIDPKIFETSEDLVRQTDALKHRFGPFVLFVGRLVGYKGVPTLIEAMHRLQDLKCRCVIIGTGPLEMELKSQAEKLGISDLVRFVGYVSDDEIQVYYHACKMLILPSISENEAFGLVQVEAMACGKITIASRLASGITEVNVDGVTGLQVPPSDPTALALAIRSLIENPTRLAEMGQAARRRFDELFTREEMVKKYRLLYRELTQS